MSHHPRSVGFVPLRFGVILALLTALVLGATPVDGQSNEGLLPPGGTFIDDDASFHEPDIEAIASALITAGCNPPLRSRFCPSRPVTRAEMAVLLVRALDEEANLGAHAGLFPDVGTGQFYSGHVERLSRLGVVLGYPDGTFRPDAPMKRSEMAALLIRALRETSPAVTESRFADVPPTAWYLPYVERLADLGITTGCRAAEFCPNPPVTRAEMAGFLRRAFHLTPFAPPTRLAPLTGFPIADPGRFPRRVIAVKIDNHRGARPQTGIGEAEAVFETLVEDDLTRWTALFHLADSSLLGPVRSGRPTDTGLLLPLGATLAVSGAQPWILDQIAAAGVPVIRELASAGAIYRVVSRWSPHNLMADTARLRTVSDSLGIPDEPPPPLFRRGSPPPTEAPAAGRVILQWSDPVAVTWVWDGLRYSRWMDGAPHQEQRADGTLTPISADILVVLVADVHIVEPPPGVAGRPVPALTTVGSGRAFLFAGGRVGEARWRRDSLPEPIRLLAPDGSELAVPPGRPWISVFPSDQPLFWSAS